MRAAVSVFLAIALTAPACKGDGETSEESSPGEADAVYTVRGEIKSVPANEGAKLYVHHEEIPDFADRSGEEVGMESMSMGFTPAGDLDLSRFSPGDRIELTFEVRWSAEPRLRATKVKKILEDTELELTDI